jgi:hypothetical protein
LVARKLALSAPAIRVVLAGIVAGSVFGVIMVRLGIGADTMFFPTYWSARLLGAHQFAGCLAVLALLLAPATRAGRVLLIAAAMIIWTGFAWSGSRAPAIGLAFALMLWFWRGAPIERRMLIIYVPPLAVIALALSYNLGTPYRQMGWWDAFVRTAQAAGLESVTSERSHFWAVTLQHALTSCWIGHGADSYLYIHPVQNGNQPHNVLLQWFLEYGLLGTVPLVLLLLRGTKNLNGQTGTFDASRPLSTWASASLAGAAIYGLMDGVFYHMVIFMPVAVIAGFAIGQHVPSRCSNLTMVAGKSLRTLLFGGVVILMVHNWLYIMLIRGRNITPDSSPARVLRIFPSTTYALRNWIDRWRSTEPRIAMEWIKWAQEAGVEQGSFHVYAAQIYIWKKDYESAENELIQSLAKVHRLERADVESVLVNVRRLRAQEVHVETTTHP